MGRLRDTWRALHVSEHGEYTPQRSEALRQYQDKASVVHSVVVCIVTPLPSLFLVAGVEAALPLAPIADGWAFASTLTLRLAICTAVMAFCMMNLARRFMPELHVPPRDLVRPAVVAAIAHTSFLWVYAALWVFPLPFAIAQTAGVFTSLCMVSFVICLGTAPFRAVPDFKRRAKLYLLQLTILNLVTMAYPAYGAFYRSQQGAAQVITVLLPLVMKSIAKAAIAKVCRMATSDPFFLPEAVHFSIELLHTLFISTCVQTTQQPLQIALVVVLFDFLPLASAYRKIAHTIRGKWRLTQGSQASFARVLPVGQPSLGKLSPQPSPASLPTTSHTSPLARQKTLRRTGSVLSSLRTRRVLYMCENHLLVEYLECVTPVSYAIYIAILFHLPNAQFYETMQTMQTPSRLWQFLASVALFVGLQLLSMVVFSALLSWRVTPTISSLHQLSFVLETQAEMVQMWFFVCMPICILSVGAHGGMDFTLQFDWIKHSRGA